MVRGATPITFIANLVSITGDPAYEMYRQATLGDVDFITGDYLAGMCILNTLHPFLVIFEQALTRILAEVNLANNALAWRNGKHPGYEETAWEGLRQTIDVIAEKDIRVVINGGALDPKALALRTKALVSKEHPQTTRFRHSFDNKSRLMRRI